MRRLKRNPDERSPARLLLILGAAVLMIIVGLLGMHTLSAGPTGHGPMSAGQHQSTASAHAAMPSGPATHAVAAAHPRPSEAEAAVSEPAVEAASGLHDGMMLACVLALLSGLLLLIAPALHRGLLRPEPPCPAHAFLTVTSVRPRPPSLIFLSISRT